MVLLNQIFADVSQGASMLAEDYQDHWNIVGSDIVDTLISRRDGVWRTYEEFLLWLDDQGHDIVLLSSDPLSSREKMVEEKCHPRLLEKPILNKTEFLKSANERRANIAAVIDDTTSILFTQHVDHIVDPQDSKFRNFIEEKRYLTLHAHIA